MTETGHTRTEDLIAQLAADARPVRPLRPPMLRAALWLLIAGLVIAGVVALKGVRHERMQEMAETSYQLEWAGAMLTGILAAIAAFHVSLPDRSRRWALLPVPGLVFWLASMGYGCLTDWIRFGPDGFVLGTSFRCFMNILMVSIPLWALLVVMLRFAGPVRPTATIVTGMLAASALVSCGVSLFHPLDTTIMVLIWHGGSIALLVGLARLFNRPLFALFAPRPVGQAS
ncbi:DUF1109 domain-containing protein [Inquilinus sp. OTU3971]|uniref:DUF1109 domain-containing protein n=1 Tax=Inquilinus sp. OTU3971 TaxID=3043855 RepID=UPI00313EC320